jgi:hypothetical protein
MAVLTPISGKKFRVWVSATVNGTYTLIKGMNASEKTTNRSVESTDTFDALNAFSEPGAREKSYRVDGLLIPDDPGQLLVRGAEATDTEMFYKFLPLGGDTDVVENVRGFTHECKVGGMRWGARTAGAQTWGFDLLSQADEVITTGGYII